MARREARLAAALGCIAEVDTDARLRKNPPTFGPCDWALPEPDGDEWSVVDWAERDGVIPGRAPCPSSETALPLFAFADFCVIVSCRLGRFAVESSDSSPVSSD